jgi:peptide/nickel transport system substrate-binding protein
MYYYKIQNRRKGLPLFVLVITAISLFANGCQSFALKVEPVVVAQDLMVVQASDCDYGGKIKSVEAIDRHTVRFQLCSPDPAFPSKIASPVFAVQDREYLDQHGGDSLAMSIEPNGTGPYLLLEYHPDERIVLQSNPNYWGVPVRMHNIVIRWASSPVSRLVELNLGNIQGMDRPEIAQYEVYYEGEILKYYDREGLNTAYLGMNNQHAPFDDRRVRMALSMLLDRQQIVNQYYPLGSYRADQFIPPSFTLGYITPFQWLETNPEEGLRLLAEAGFDFDQEITLTYNDKSSDYLPRALAVAQDIRTQLGNFGIKVTLKWMSEENFRQAIASGSEAFYLTGWSADYPDPSNFYDSVFQSDSLQMGVLDPQIHATVQAASTASDPKIRQEFYQLLNQLLRNHVPAIPVVHGNTKLVFSNRVEGVLTGPLNENFPQMNAPGEVFAFMQTHPPGSLWPADETDTDTFRITSLLYSTLVEYEFGGTHLRPGLAESWSSNTDQTEWTFYLRYGVSFTNQATLDANDVVASFAAIWDSADPNHRGRSGNFELYRKYFGDFLNP